MPDLSQLRTQLIAAFQQHAWPHVQQLAAQLLPLTPGDGDAHFFAGIASLELQQLPQALAHLDAASRLFPDRADFATQYARALVMTRQLGDARRAADRALALSPDHPSMLDTLGVVYTQTNALEQAAVAFRRAVAMAPNFAPYRFNLAYSLIAMGDSQGAERELEASIRLEPRHWIAHLSLAQLRRQGPTDNHLGRLQSLLSRQGNDIHAQVYLHMALAKEYEDIAEYGRAFEHYVQGNAAARRTRPYSIRRDEVMVENLMRRFPAVDAATPAGDPTDEPIFVIGMPRTGTTLLERIISSHPDMYSAGELQNFPAALQAGSGSPTPILLDPEMSRRTRDIDWPRLGASYLASTRPATSGKPHFVDKLPHNFLYAGFIARALPRAKLICLRRDPIDTCLSNFRHLFEQESSFYDYSCDLLDTGGYYVLFDRLMAHWQRVLPGRILEMPYESLVTAQEASTRCLLEFCGLSWNDACLHFEDNPAPVNTPNAWQVRAPIFRTALGRWKHYVPQLAGLRALLEQAGIQTAR